MTPGDPRTPLTATSVDGKCAKAAFSVAFLASSEIAALAERKYTSDRQPPTKNATIHAMDPSLFVISTIQDFIAMFSDNISQDKCHRIAVMIHGIIGPIRSDMSRKTTPQATPPISIQRQRCGACAWPTIIPTGNRH